VLTAAVHFAESAVADLEDLRAWYEAQGVREVGDRLIDEIFQSIEALADHPDMGRIVPEFEQRFLREIILPNFRLVYRRDERHFWIVRIWRSERLLALPGK